MNHSGDWSFGEYNEIQEPKRKKVLIDYDRLRQLPGFENYEQVKEAHKKWVESALITLLRKEMNGIEIREATLSGFCYELSTYFEPNLS